ncbi:helix-turn-helix domain-containing protein [Brevibacillus sp. FSL L8-0710]|uniref:helix-turn-helix domain-containing protein n=1 Tax=Brevibacillus sp. FSL L8-0710 TaxID=2975313 RepID=UPI0030FC2C08
MPYKAGKCRLGVILKARRIKIVEFAKQINMSPNQLNDYIHNRKKMSLSVAMTIAAALGIRIEELYEWEFVAPSQRKRTKKE